MGVLDELKAKYRISSKAPVPKTMIPEPTRYPLLDQPYKSSAFPGDFFGTKGYSSPGKLKSKTVSQKPQSLANVFTKPNYCPPDVEYKIQGPKQTDYQPLQPYMKNTTEVQTNIDITYQDPSAIRKDLMNKVIQTDFQDSLLNDSLLKRQTNQYDENKNNERVHISFQPKGQTGNGFSNKANQEENERLMSMTKQPQVDIEHNIQ